jgi:hypothetical protein
MSWRTEDKTLLEASKYERRKGEVYCRRVTRKYDHYITGVNVENNLKIRRLANT